MEKSLINDLVCPQSGEKLNLKRAEYKGKEIVSGELYCKESNLNYYIKNGIPLLTYFPLDNQQHKVKEMFNETPYGLIGSRDSMMNQQNLSIKTIHKSPWYIRENDVKGKKWLEAGCGGGHLYTELDLLGANIIGFDQTPNSLNHINKLFKEFNKIPKLINGNIEEIPIKENTFDIVTSMGVIHHTPRTQRALNNLARVTKKGGHVHIMVYHKHSIWNYIKNILRFGCNYSRLFSKLIFNLTKYWMGETASQSNQETVFRDNMVNAITKSYSARELKKMAKKSGLKILFLSRYEIPELYVFGRRIYQSHLLRWYEKRFGWFLYAKMVKI